MKKTILFLLLISGVGYLYYSGVLTDALGLEGNEAIENSTTGNDTPLYLELDPPLVVNFNHRGTLRYLQMSLELMYYDQNALDQVEVNMPAIRNDLILLISNQEFETLSTIEGKEQLRNDILLAVNNIIQPESGNLDLGKVYFTNFIMQ